MITQDMIVMLWFFEGGNAAKIIAKFNISKIWAMASLIRDIVRYF